MFVRHKTFTNKNGTTRTYLQLVETVRDDGHVRQRVLLNLGRLDDPRLRGQFRRLAEELRHYANEPGVLERVAGVDRVDRGEWGPVTLFEFLWLQLGMPCIFRRLSGSDAVASSVNSAVFAMVLNRLVEPLPRLDIARWVASVASSTLGSPQAGEYEAALEFLAQHASHVGEEVFAALKDTLSPRLDSMLWVPVYGRLWPEGPLTGPSVEGPSARRTALTLTTSILLTADGLPAAHHVSDGKLTHADPLRKGIETLGGFQDTTKVMVVSNRLLATDAGMAELESSGLRYLLELPLRSGRTLSEVLSRPGRYRNTISALRLKEVRFAGRRYFVCRELADHVPPRTASASRPRDAVQSFLQERSGRCVLVTNDPTLAPEDAVRFHETAAGVYGYFREIRPALRLTFGIGSLSAPVNGWMIVEYLAFVLESVLKKRLTEISSETSFPDAIEDLKQVRTHEFDLGGVRYVLHPPLRDASRDAFKAAVVRPECGSALEDGAAPSAGRDEDALGKTRPRAVVKPV